jgi:hypothetical protein
MVRTREPGDDPDQKAGRNRPAPGRHHPIGRRSLAAAVESGIPALRMTIKLDYVRKQVLELFEPWLERLSTEWNHSVDKRSLDFKELEHVLIEKTGQFFRNML